MSLIWYLILLFVSVGSNGTKIWERFPKTNATCRVSSMKIPDILPPEYKSMGDKFTELTKNNFEIPGCRIALDLVKPDLGSLQPNGSYDGLLGRLQRKEMNVLAVPGWSGLVQTDDIILGPPVQAIDLMILSKKNGSIPINIHITDFYQNFDEITYMYIFLVAFIFITLIIAFKFVTQMRIGRTKRGEKNSFTRIVMERVLDARHTRRQIWIEYFNGAQQFMKLCLGQTDWDFDDCKSRILWFFFSSSIFVLIFGIYLNLMSSDLSVQKELPTVESFDDLLEFGGTPFVVAGMPAEHILKHHRPESKFGKIWKIISESPDNIIVYETDHDKYFAAAAKYNSYNRELADYGTRNMIMNSFGHYFTLWVLCETRQAWEEFEKVGETKISREHVAFGTVNILMSTGIDHALRKRMEYRIRNMLEFHILTTFVKETLYGRPWKSIKCALQLEDPEEQSVEPFNLAHMSHAFFLICYLYCLGIIILMIECLTHSCGKKRKNRIRPQISLAETH